MLLPLLIDIHTGVDSFYYKIDKGVSAVQEMKNDTFDDLFPRHHNNQQAILNTSSGSNDQF